MNFVRIALDELFDSREEDIRYNSLSTRLAKLDNDEFARFMKEIEPKSNPTPVVDHLAQMKQAQQG